MPPDLMEQSGGASPTSFMQAVTQEAHTDGLHTYYAIIQV